MNCCDEAHAELIRILEAENARLREALKEIAETEPEVSVNGVCSYCDSRTIARAALSGCGPALYEALGPASTPAPIVSCAHCGVHDLLPAVEARQAALDGPGLEKFTERFRREVKAGRR
jgi:hypothetical protein